MTLEQSDGEGARTGDDDDECEGVGTGTGDGECEGEGGFDILEAAEFATAITHTTINKILVVIVN